MFSFLNNRLFPWCKSFHMEVNLPHIAIFILVNLLSLNSFVPGHIFKPRQKATKYGLLKLSLVYISVPLINIFTVI